MKHLYFEEIIYENKSLGLTVLNNGTESCDFKPVSTIVHEEFALLAPYIHNKRGHKNNIVMPEA
jgi:hypothetical protein